MVSPTSKILRDVWLLAWLAWPVIYWRIRVCRVILVDDGTVAGFEVGFAKGAELFPAYFAACTIHCVFFNECKDEIHLNTMSE